MALAGIGGPVLAAGPAASDLAPFAESLEVPLVETEVIVVGADGAPVLDLQPSEFRLLEDDLPVDSFGVQRVGGGSAGAVNATARAAAEEAAADGGGLRLAIFLDEVHVGAATRRQLLRDLAAALERNLGPRDEVTLVAYDGAVRVLLPFTAERRALRRALEESERVSLKRLAVEQERLSTLENLYLDATRGLGWSPCLHIQEFVDRYAGEEYDRVLAAASAFGGFVDAFAALGGRKAILHVSDGIPLRAGAEAADQALELCSGVAATQGRDRVSDVSSYKDIFDPQTKSLEANRFDTSGRWEAIAARAGSGNVTLFTVQGSLPSGAVAEASSSLDTRVSAVVAARRLDNLREPLFRLADRTGGRSFLQGGLSDREVAGAIGDLRRYYLLTHAPRDAGRSGVRRLRVEVDRAGVTVRHRKTYSLQTAHQRVATSLLGRLLFGDGPATASGGAAPRIELVSSRGGEAGRIRARLRAHIPLGGLVGVAREQGAPQQGMFSVFVAASEEGGGSSGVRHSVLPVSLPPSDATPATTEEFVWEVEMLLRPGRQRIGIAVRDEIGGATRFAVRDLDIALGG